jgi:hypothetical protein
MTDGCTKQMADELDEIDTDLDDVEAVDPEELAALDDEASTDSDGPAPETFDGFVRDVDTERVASAERADDDVPIDASMDELFAER